MSRRLAALAATLLLAGAALVATGCERRSESVGPVGGAPAARVVVSADHGDEVLLDERVVPGRSVLKTLAGITPVQTAYGGGFVDQMLGRGSSSSPSIDWFFFVNGIESPVGAGAVDLSEGDIAWWDHRAWSGMQSVRGVVGSWPEPFLHGAGAAEPVVSADPPLAGALRAVGARLGSGERPFRVRVGSDADLTKRDPTWRAIAGDPAARALPGGVANSRIVLMPAGGGAPAPEPKARAVAVLVPVGLAPADGALLAIAGLDSAAASAAAATIAADPAVLSLRYAVAFDDAGTPLRAAGRPGP